MRGAAGSSRERLRAAAKALFAEKGYEATAISDITRAAQTSHSQFLKYYANKEELRREIVDEQWAELTKAIILASLSVPSPAEKLRLALNMLISFLENDARFRAIALLENPAIREKGAPRASREFRNFVAVLDDLLSAMQSDQQLRPGIEVQAFRSALLGAVEGMMRDQMLNHEFPAGYSVEQVRSMLSLMIDSAADVQRPSADWAPSAGEAVAASAGAASAASEEAWIRYYLKLADRALHPSEMS